MTTTGDGSCRVVAAAAVVAAIGGLGVGSLWHELVGLQLLSGGEGSGRRYSRCSALGVSL